MKAILLCAGYATRLKPLTDTLPKPLLPLAGRPMIDYLIDQLKFIPDLDQIILVSNAKFFDSFQKWKEKTHRDLPIHILNDGSTDNENRLGAIRDIAFAISEEKIVDDCLVLAGDNYFDSDLQLFAQQAILKSPKVTIAVYDVRNRELAKRYGLVVCDQDGFVSGFQEKPQDPKTTLASTGVYCFPKSNLKLINEYLRNHQNPDAPGNYIQWLVGQGQVFSFSFKGTWYDIGDFESYRKADQEIRQKQSIS